VDGVWDCNFADAGGLDGLSTPVSTSMFGPGGGRPDAENQVNLLFLATHFNASGCNRMRFFMSVKIATKSVCQL
jgi:hypothetical protein